MTIATRDQLINAMGNASTRVRVDKASVANTTAGGYHSLWRATGVPGQAAIPAAAAICTAALLGAMGFTNPVSPARTYVGNFRMACANSATDIEIHDRLAHMGGLNGTLTAAQTVNVDASDPLLTNRIGEADYSDVQWFLEWYSDTGATGVNATCAVTYDDGSVGNVVVALAATMRASRMLPILPAVAGRWIKSVQSVTLSATTGTAGSFGVTATRFRAFVGCNVANKTELYDWAALGLPQVPDDACLMLVCLPSTTTTGAIRGGGKLIQG